MRKYKKVYVEITNICNLKCSFCPSPRLQRPLQFLSEEKFKHVLAEVRPFTDHIYFHLMGEPFMNKQFYRFLELSDEVGLKVNITTNGTLIHKVKDELLQAKALRQLNFSLHSFEANEMTRELHDYIDSVARFIVEANEKSEIICAIRLWNMDGQTLKAANSLNSEILALLEEKLGLDMNLAEQLQTKFNVKLRDRIYLNMAEKFAWPDMANDVYEGDVFCHGLRDQFGILVDGTVVPCCLDSEGKIPLGNLYETPLADILNGERARNIYDGFSRRCAVEELCKRCGYAKNYQKSGY